MKESYFNINRVSHVKLMESIQDIDVRPQDTTNIFKFGKATQHVFKNGYYMMTINWNLV